MRLALAEAQKAQKAGEIPTGAVAVSEGRIIARGHSRSIRDHDPSAHAEMVVLRKAARKLKNYRLNGIILYVTLEPCPMCAGALVWARIQELVYGAPNRRAGACGGILDIQKFSSLNHRFKITSGVLQQECQNLIKDFFKNKR